MKRLCLYPIILLVCLCLGCQKTAPAAEPTAAAQTAAPTATPAPVTELTLSDGEPLDVAAISGMTALKRLDMRAAAATAEQYDLIRAALPDCEILWRVPVGQTSLDSTETAVVLTDAAGLENLKYFPGLQSADLTSCTLTDDERLALIERYPNVAFQWAFTIEGVSVDSATETLDLSGKRISDPETLVKQLKCLPNLKKVDLCDCNLTDEQMRKYYKKIAAELGGRCVAQYQNAICLVFSENEIYEARGGALNWKKFCSCLVPTRLYSPSIWLACKKSMNLIFLLL